MFTSHETCIRPLCARHCVPVLIPIGSKDRQVNWEAVSAIGEVSDLA